MDQMVTTGIFETSYLLLKATEVAPGFSRMMRHYGQRLLRFDDLGVAPPEIIDRFLLDTPINILCVGGPPLHSWWEERNKTL